MDTTIGQLLIRDSLPDGVTLPDGKPLDKKAIKELLQQVAEKNPDKYKEVLNKLSDVGKNVAWESGVTVSLTGLGRSKAKEKLLNPIRKKMDQIIEDESIDTKTRNKKLIDLVKDLGKPLQDALLEEARLEGNPFYDQIISGARGNPSSFSSLRGADLLVTDQDGEIVPVPILSSYAEGLSPAEYFATTFGQRSGMLTVKMATADAGFLGKKLNNATHRMVVTRDKPNESRLPVGLPTTVDDEDNVGAVLAKDAGPFKAGEVLTKRALRSLKSEGVEDILVHSVLTDLNEDGGVSALAAGRRTRSGLNEIGDNVGLPAAQALAERLSQGVLDCLVEGTKVLMGDFTVKSIEDINVGDSVMGANKAGEIFPVRVNRTFNNGVQPCVRTEFYFGQTKVAELESTTAHKCLVSTQFTNHSEQPLNHVPRVLPIGKKCRDLRAIRPQGFIGTGLREDKAYLLGMLLGDGCYTNSVNGVHFSCADSILVNNLKHYLASINLRLTYLHDVYYRVSTLEMPKYDRQATKQTYVAGTYYNPAKVMLVRMGCYGKYAHEKFIPEEAYGWDNHSVADLLAGLIDTDGTVFLRKFNGVESLGIGFSSTSLRMLEQVRELFALRFGVYFSATKVSKAGRKRALYTIHCTDRLSVLNFAREIRLKGIKAAKVANWVTKEVQGSRLKSAGSVGRKAQKPIGDKQCYDIEVDHEDHLFVLANWLIVSNSKHSAGVNTRVSKAGFEYINRLIEAPENFPEAGPLAEEPGEVRSISEAPQGGKVVTVGEREYYLSPGIEPIVKVGDEVDAGDDISDGTPHPTDLVRLRGIGEARRVYMDLLREGLANSGVPQNRRNLEAVVGGLINWAQVTNPDGIGDHIVDDIVPFNRLAAQYKPRPNAQLVPASTAAGKYLEEPVLHYTPGTRVNKSVLADLHKWGIKDVTVNDDEPDFQPHMVRGVHSVYNDPDWRTRLSGFYTAEGFKDSVRRGRVSDTNSTSFVPGLTVGTGFGDQLKQTGQYGSKARPMT